MSSRSARLPVAPLRTYGMSWTPALRRIARHILLGYDTKEIAKACGVKQQVAKNFLIHVLRLVGCECRQEAISVIMHDDDLLYEIYELKQGAIHVHDQRV